LHEHAEALQFSSKRVQPSRAAEVAFNKRCVHGLQDVSQRHLTWRQRHDVGSTAWCAFEGVVRIPSAFIAVVSAGGIF
jgi:hypothetical protein